MTMTFGSQYPARRLPRQDRSRAMVERILEAGREVLLERGYERTSTSRIARTAGISPGSLYQYFPNKEAILGQVLDRYTERLHSRITHAFMANLGAGSDRDTVRGTVAALLDALESDVGLLRVLAEQLPRGASRQRDDFAKRVDQLVTTALLFRLGDSVRPVDASAWILVRSIQAVTVGYVLDPPPISRDVIVGELTDLIVSYLSRPARPR